MAANFTGDTKELLSRIPVRSRSQRRAELHAIISGIGSFPVDEMGLVGCVLQSESLPAVRRGDYLLRALKGLPPVCRVFRGGRDKPPLFVTETQDFADAGALLEELGFMSPGGALREIQLPAPEHLIDNEACARAFLRGAFLAGGYVSDPGSAYHWELVCAGLARGEELKRLLERWELPARLTCRKGKYLVYLKSAEAISTVLSLMGAYQSTLRWESARALKSLQGQVNRQVNCETANLAKSAQAGVEQTRAIRKIEENIGLKSLPAALQEIALLRLENPELPLKELGDRLDPPVGKSGVNHRLRKLMQIAEEL